MGYSMHSKAYRIYNKCTKTIEESIYMIFDESNDGVLSGSIAQNLHLSKYVDDDEEATKEENPADENHKNYKKTPHLKKKRSPQMKKTLRLMHLNKR